MELAASIASGDLARLVEMAVEAETGGADRIHLDIEDGVFVPTFTVGPAAVASIRRAVRLPLDVHLQTVEPERWIAMIAKGRADRVVVHVESLRDPRQMLEAVRRSGMSVGVALFLRTPVGAVAGLLPHVDSVTVMSTNDPREKFSTRALDKIRSLVGRVREIAVDGAVTPEILPDVIRAGATVAVIGRALFAPSGAGVQAGIASFRAAERSTSVQPMR
jgi:ribulose-phosphate 3-epimerase